LKINVKNVHFVGSYYIGRKLPKNSKSQKYEYFYNTGRFIMYSGITEMYDRKTVGHVDRVFVPQLPCDLTDLKARIIAAVKNIDVPMLTRVNQELQYSIDVCRVTRGAHIEHL
jgi:hypothetical protein